jgi:hypothetical protein
VTVGDVMIQAHSSVMQIAFYDPPEGATTSPRTTREARS